MAYFLEFTQMIRVLKKCVGSSVFKDLAKHLQLHKVYMLVRRYAGMVSCQEETTNHQLQKDPASKHLRKEQRNQST